MGRVVVRSALAPDGPPPSGLLDGYSYNWSTQEADLGFLDDIEPSTTVHDRLADRVGGVNKWNVGVSRRRHGQIVSAPSFAPFPKWLRIEFQDASGTGLHEVALDNLPIIGTDQVQTTRWYESYDQPGDVGAANNMHGIGAKTQGGDGELWTQDASYDEMDGTNTLWTDFFVVPGEVSGNQKWGVWPNTNFPQGTYSNNHLGQYRYTKGQMYMKVVQLRRLGSSESMRMKIWTFTVNHTTGAHALLHGPADYRNEDGDLTLADDPEIVPGNSMDLTGCFKIGSNGISPGPSGYPLPFMHIGPVGIAYGQLAEGTPMGGFGALLQDAA